MQCQSLSDCTHCLIFDAVRSFSHVIAVGRCFSQAMMKTSSRMQRWQRAASIFRYLAAMAMVTESVTLLECFVPRAAEATCGTRASYQIQSAPWRTWATTLCHVATVLSSSGSGILLSAHKPLGHSVARCLDASHSVHISGWNTAGSSRQPFCPR